MIQIDEKQPNTLILVSTKQLTDFAKHIVDGVLRLDDVPPAEIKESKNPDLLTQPQAIKFLQKSRQTLIHWRRKGIIQAYKISGRVYFKKDELLEALERI